MKIYLAASYSKREELCGYRNQLQALGHNVQARWLDGKHQLDNTGTPIGDHGEKLVEDGNDSKNAVLRAKFAQDDWEDVTAAELVINFTEPPGQRPLVEEGMSNAESRSLAVHVSSSLATAKISFTGFLRLNLWKLGNRLYSS